MPEQYFASILEVSKVQSILSQIGLSAEIKCETRLLSSQKPKMGGLV